eukprot:14826974-Ditylum_brightwellii.AAC.1
MTIKGDLLEDRELMESVIPETLSLGWKKKPSRPGKTRNNTWADGEMPKESGPAPSLFSPVHGNVLHMSDSLNKRGASLY